MNRIFIKIIEHNEHECESWCFMIPVEGNEAFIEKLNAAICKFECEDLEIVEELPEFEVNILEKHSFEGYMPDWMKIDKIINPGVIDDSSEDAFINSYYKGKYFTN
jgi:hypothetical protein